MADGPALSTKVNRGVAWAATSQAVIAIAELVSQTIVLALFVGDGDYGTASAAFAYYAMLDTAADLGVTSSLIQLDDHTPERVSTVFWFNVLVSGALFLALLVIGPLYGRFQGNAIVGTLLLAYGSKLLLQNVYSIPYALLRKELRFAEIAKARILAHLTESVARVVFAAMGATIWCFTLAPLARTLVFGVVMQLRHPFLPRFVFRPREVIPYVRFGLVTAASQVLYQLYTNLDYAVVYYFFGARANGVYTLAYFIVLEPVKMIANVVIDVAYPTFARIRGDRPGLVRQFIEFTRLNLLAVLPFVVLIALIVPEFLHVFYARKWTPAELDTCADAARILCLVGMLRALGFIGPPLLDGIGRPALTLRYMVVATILVPGSFVLGAWLLGDRYGLLSVAIAWAAGYPLAFAVLSYLVARTIGLPVGAYLRACWGIIGCCVAGLAAGYAARLVLADASDLVRMIASTVATFAVMLALLVTWQKITPRTIRAALQG